MRLFLEAFWHPALRISLFNPRLRKYTINYRRHFAFPKDGCRIKIRNPWFDVIPAAIPGRGSYCRSLDTSSMMNAKWSLDSTIFRSRLLHQSSRFFVFNLNLNVKSWKVVEIFFLDNLDNEKNWFSVIMKQSY